MLSPDESDLVNLFTGTVTPSGVVKDLLRAFEVGEEEYQSFKRTRLDDDPPSMKFHDKMTKQRLKTFSTISAKSYQMKGQDVVLKAHRNLFSQMILVAESRSENMTDVHCATAMGKCRWIPTKNKQRHLPGSLRKMYLLQTLSQLHQPVSLMGYVWYKRMNGNNKIFAQLAVCLVHSTVCWWTEW